VGVHCWWEPFVKIPEKTIKKDIPDNAAVYWGGEDWVDALDQATQYAGRRKADDVCKEHHLFPVLIVKYDGEVAARAEAPNVVAERLDQPKGELALPPLEGEFVDLTAEQLEAYDDEAVDERLRSEARRFADSRARFRLTRERLQLLIGHAQSRQIYRSLGHRSWTTYVRDVIRNEMGQLDVEDRREVVKVLADEQMSDRQIAAALGVSHTTVASDRKVNDPADVQVETDLPREHDWIVGADGKRYPTRGGKSETDDDGDPDLSDRSEQSKRTRNRRNTRIRHSTTITAETGKTTLFCRKP
jgi:hypothetical protein